MRRNVEVKQAVWLALPACLLASVLRAECYRPQGAAACEQKCLGSNFCVIMLTGAGSVTEGDLRYRAKWIDKHFDLGAEQVVMFRPSGRLFGWSWWTDEDVKEVNRFIATRRNLGEHLNFIVSSAAVPRFENEIWPELPPVVGTVVINQPYYQPLTGQHRAILRAGVKPKFFVVYTLEMPKKDMAIHEAGPSRFEDPAVRVNYVVLDGRKLDLDHGKATGRGEELAFSLMPPLVNSDRTDAYQIVRSHIEKFGVAESSYWRDPIPNYWTSDYDGKPRGKAAAEAASMSGFVRHAKRIVIAGEGAGVRDARKILERPGVEVILKPHFENQDAAVEWALQQKVKPDAILGFYEKKNPKIEAASGKKRGGVFAGIEVSDADFRVKEKQR